MKKTLGCDPRNTGLNPVEGTIMPLSSNEEDTRFRPWRYRFESY